jgi:hypothetical protein
MARSATEDANTVVLGFEDQRRRRSRASTSRFRKLSADPGAPANQIENRSRALSRRIKRAGRKIMPMSGEAILENVRRYRAIASLYRQTAAFRPLQRCSLLGQAEEWEHLAVNELEAYFRLRDIPAHNLQTQGT